MLNTFCDISLGVGLIIFGLGAVWSLWDLYKAEE